MNWAIGFSEAALRFLRVNRIPGGDIFDIVRAAAGMFRGQPSAINIKKLKGKWDGFYRIRKGKLRIIIEFRFDQRAAFIERIDWRGSVYK
jgi:mRNA-degrading endonuclease RelE of RelBE toxin-antitoxin system